MNTTAIIAALIGFFFPLASILAYVRNIPRGTVPKKVGSFATVAIIGTAFTIVSIFLAVTGEGYAGVLVYIPAVLGLLLSGLNALLFCLPSAPLGDLKVDVGDPLLPFSAVTSEGHAFDTSTFNGKRVLLKFYRGGWCPYCSSELMAFDEMTGELERYNISIFALSRDTPEQATVHKLRDGLSFPLLTDANLDVIRQYGVEHHKVLSMDENPKKKIGGIPLGTGKPKLQTMAIPTTLLVDETGIIRWIDQSEDYRIRSSTDRIINAVKEVFG